MVFGNVYYATIRLGIVDTSSNISNLNICLWYTRVSTVARPAQPRMPWASTLLELMESRINVYAPINEQSFYFYRCGDRTEWKYDKRYKWFLEVLALEIHYPSFGT